MGINKRILNGSRVFSPAVMVLVLTGILFILGCGRSDQTLPTPVVLGQNLPAYLRVIAATTPGGAGARLYKIGLSSAMSLAVMDDGLYAIDENENGFPYRLVEGEKDWTRLIGGTRTLSGLAIGGNSEVLYAYDHSGNVWRLQTGGEQLQPIDSPSRVEGLAVSMDGHVIYAQTGNAVWWSREGEKTWQLLEIEREFENKLGDEFEDGARLGKLVVGPGVVYGVVECAYEIPIGRGDSVCGTTLASWYKENGWSSLWNLGNDIVESLAVSGDGKDVYALTSGGDLWAKGRQWPISQELVNYGVTSFLYDSQHPGVLYVGTKKGLFLTMNSGVNWEIVGGQEGQGRAVNAIIYHPRWQVPLVATDDGVYFVILQQQQQRGVIAEAWDTVARFYDENHDKAWFGPMIVLGGFSTTYILGMTALLLLAWQGGSTIFSRTWLYSIAAKPLLITPGLGRWALFLGYQKRLAKLKAVNQASKDYFGLPAEDPTGSVVLPDLTGETLNERIIQVLGPQQPVVIIGKGGAGKSTLLARWAFLALKGQLPASLKGFRPVLISASYYGGNLVKAIADTLRERDGVAVDEETTRTQLQSGRFLLLFDGITEVETNKQESLLEILRTCRHADFQGCRFLVSTRPLEGIPDEISTFQLRPLTLDVISVLLPRYGLERERESQVRRQLQSFGAKPIEPLLFAMALAQSSDEKVSNSRAQLYERYFRRLLKVGPNETLWSGWRAASEILAQWFLLSPGKRGIGLPHEPLVQLIVGEKGKGQEAENLVERLRRLYRLPVKDELDLLQQLEAAGLLQGGRRWRFAHDTFEEYFAASYLVSHFDQEERWPSLDKWIGLLEREQEFLEVLDFMREMTDEPTRQHILNLDLPSSWKERLEQENGG